MAPSTRPCATETILIRPEQPELKAHRQHASCNEGQPTQSGFLVELQCGNHCWRLAWQSKRQTSAAISTAGSETISLQ
eukprot:9746243-Heterocapsa_arctica.AAC.1